MAEAGLGSLTGKPVAGLISIAAGEVLLSVVTISQDGSTEYLSFLLGQCHVLEAERDRPVTVRSAHPHKIPGEGENPRGGRGAASRRPPSGACAGSLIRVQSSLSYWLWPLQTD